MKILFLFIATLFFFTFPGLSQEKEKNYTLCGYIKDMQTVIMGDPKENWITDNLIHNRMNFNWYPNDNLALNIELRTRFIWGEMISMESMVPDSLLLFKYSDFIDRQTGYVNASGNILKEKSFILHSSLERFCLTWTKGKFRVDIGRQRINWGQSFVWNPNDIFNAYSFFDFDYEEKPGSDAVRLQYYSGAASQAEIAVKADHNEKITAACLFRFNKWNYDIQFLGGILAEEDIVAGAGWSGQLLKGGFMGEATWFQPVDNIKDTVGVIAISAGYNYTFKNSLFLQFEALYNSNGRTDSSFNLQEFYYTDLSARNLSLNRFSVFGMMSYPVSPLLTAGFSIMYSPNDKSLYLGPTAGISLADNFDLQLSAQAFLSDNSALEGGKGAFVFVRFRHSF
ncbi:MAG: hypothetical protein ABIJ16_07675 [Bacteroidota bacterium]